MSSNLAAPTTFLNFIDYSVAIKSHILFSLLILKYYFFKVEFIDPSHCLFYIKFMQIVASVLRIVALLASTPFSQNKITKTR